MNYKSCRGCSIEGPPKRRKKALIMFVGLSAKPNAGELCPTTNSGKLIKAIEERVESGLSIYKTNSVKCAPLDNVGKLRYPTEAEMKACLPMLRAEINVVAPRVIVPLGGQVARFLLGNLSDGHKFMGFSPEFQYDTYALPLGQAMPIHHPSYIWIYKRKQIDIYVDRVGKQLSDLVLA